MNTLHAEWAEEILFHYFNRDYCRMRQEFDASGLKGHEVADYLVASGYHVRDVADFLARIKG